MLKKNLVTKQQCQILLCGLLLFSSSCKMTSVYVDVMKPAPITITNDIRSIALVNRTAPESKFWNILEGIATGEMIEQDKQGAERTLDGVVATMSESPRFTLVRTSKRLRTKSIRGELSEPLPWPDILSICKENNTQAVLALEAFDSDFIVTGSSKESEVKEKDGRVHKVTEYYASGLGKVKLGFRLYDAATKSIADQYIFDHEMSWEAKGNSPRDAAAHLLGRMQAVRETGYDAGNIYAERICPLWIRVSRSFFKKPKDNPDFAAGVRKAEVGDWKGAAAEWQKVLRGNDKEAAGRAAYNMAVANEIEGNLNEAKEWAQKAYTDYGIKEARRYVSILNQRIWDEEKLKEQLKNIKTE